MASGPARTALVTGANRGIGFEAAQALARAGLAVVVTCRDYESGHHAARRVRGAGYYDVTCEPLDVTDGRSVDACVRRLAAAGVAVDVLVNNAGVLLDDGADPLALDLDVVRQTLEVNLLGVLRTCQAFVPGMVERGYGRVVNVSSGAGQVTETTAYAPAYSISKAALNLMTRKLARAVSGDVKVNAVCPGWVRTDMGGTSAPRSAKEAADTIVWLATLPEDGPTDGFFRDREPVAW